MEVKDVILFFAGLIGLTIRSCIKDRRETKLQERKEKEREIWQIMRLLHDISKV
jgi:hypothetical protein